MASLAEPLRFERLCLTKVWGGTALARYLGFEAAPGQKIGETWEVVDRPGEQSRVAGGPHAGRSLGELMVEHGEELLGKAPATKEGRFPLLVKYIDADEALSVQVHPDDAAARALGGEAEGKSEAWYFLEGREGGAVWSGLEPKVTAERLRAAAGTAAMVPLLRRHAVEAGTSLTVAGGTVHAIGAGVTLLEVQQNSDTTYRLYDWDRMGLDGKPRALHLEEGCRVAHIGRVPLAPVAPDWHPHPDGFGATGGRRAPMARSAHFAMNRLELERPTRLSTGNQYQIYAVTDGACRLVVKAAGAGLELERGDVVLVPAAADYHVFEPRGEPLGIVQLLYRA